jgi:hypothetical protein
MDSPKILLLVVLMFASIATYAVASDPSPLQDFCVADDMSKGTYNRYMRF